MSATSLMASQLFHRGERARLAELLEPYEIAVIPRTEVRWPVEAPPGKRAAPLRERLEPYRVTRVPGARGGSTDPGRHRSAA